MRKRTLTSGFLSYFLFFFLFSGPSSFFQFPLAHANQTLEIMTYNVENLFDIEHDEDKEDWTFLPKGHPLKAKGCQTITSPFYRSQCYNTDWNQKKLNLKLKQIRRMLLSERTSLPDILTLNEIENENVLRQLAQTLGYDHYYITNGPDERGIDVAILYQPRRDFKMIQIKEHNLYELGVLSQRTRNILEATFSVGKNFKLVIFINHWPSQANPVQDRLAISRYLAKQIKARLQEPNTQVLALGDFNTLESDRPHPINSVLTLKNRPLLKDIWEEHMSKLTTSERSKLPLGTHYYSQGRSWSHLDKILVSSNLLRVSRSQDWPQIDLKSVQIYTPSFSTTTIENKLNLDWELPEFDGEEKSSAIQIPKRYNFSANNADEAGYSDHFPLTVKIHYQ